MPMFMKLKLSKRVNSKLPMIVPGRCDNDILPSGGSSSSGITLDYSAIQGGGVDNGVAINHVDDAPKKIKVRKAPDFAETGTWLVETPQGIKKIFCDVYSTRWWYEDLGRPTKDRLEGFLGFNKTEALEKLLQLYPKIIEINEADDFSGKNYWMDWETQKGRHNMSNDMWYEIINDLIPLSKAKNEDVVWAWIKSLQVRMGIPPKNFPEIKKIVDQFRATNYAELKNYNEVEDAPAELLLFLRQHSKTDPEWIKRNQVEYSDKENETDDPYNDDTRGRGSFVGSHESGFELRHSLDSGSTVASISISKRAYPNLPAYSDPNLYQQSLNPRNEATPEFDIFNTYFTDDEIECEDEDDGKTKKAFPDYPIYNGNSQMYDQVTEKTDYNQTPAFNMWNTYYADDVIETNEDDKEDEEVEKLNKQAFIKTAISYDSNNIIQQLIAIPEIKSLLDQQASGYVEKIIVTTPGADFQQTQQQLNTQPNTQVNLKPIDGSPYGHVWISEDPNTHQKKPLDKIVRIDRVTDQWGTLVTILHEIAHHRHPEWSEGQVEAEAEKLAGTVKQFLGAKTASKKILFVKNNLGSLPIVECELADTYQKQVIGLQNHNTLKPEHGMMFPYNREQPLSFWMGKVAFPIDIIFADKNNTIVKIYRNCKPNSNEIFACDRASKVIEVVGSFCAFHDLDVGDQVFAADDEPYHQEDFTKYIIERIKDVKLEQQKELKMENWSIKIVMKKEPDSRKFLKVNWTPGDYILKKADILVNPDPILIEAALKKMSLEKLVRHSLLHILTGHKKELPEDREQELITNRL